MYRCKACGSMLYFYGITQLKQEGWMRWSVCHRCSLYYKDNGVVYVLTTKTEPPKSIFHS